MTRKLFLFALVVLFSASVAQAARFTVDSISGDRVVKKKGVLTTTLRDTGGVGNVLTTIKKAKSSSLDKMFATVEAKTFTGVGTETATVTMGFKGVGPMSVPVTFDIGQKLVKGNWKPLLLDPANSAMLTYQVHVLEARKLSTAKGKGGVGFLKYGDVLRGANMANHIIPGESIPAVFKVVTMNKKNDGSWTNVAVAPVNFSSFEQKKVLVAAGNQLTVNAKTVTSQTLLAVDNVLITGRLTEYNNKLNAMGKVDVITDEADTIVDPTAYKQLKLKYKANVGIAKKYQKKPGKDGSPAMQDFGAAPKVQILSAYVGAGEQLADYNIATPGDSYTLSSMIRENGTLADSRPGKDGTIAPGLVDGDIKSAADNVQYSQRKNGKWKASKANLKKLYKAVGSEAEIVASNASAAGGKVSMQWRVRTRDEAHRITEGVIGQLPLDASVPPRNPKWLTSDVVKVSGDAINSDVYYVLQMTFDNRINLAFEGQIQGQLDLQWKDSWVGQLNAAGTGWERAALGAGHYDDVDGYGTLTAFLNQYMGVEGKSLETLYNEGHWGVDETNSKSWAIVRGGGSGIFAVVPEPATVIMMLSATLGAMAYGWRRWSRKPELSA